MGKRKNHLDRVRELLDKLNFAEDESERKPHEETWELYDQFGELLMERVVLNSKTKAAACTTYGYFSCASYPKIVPFVEMLEMEVYR